LVNILTLKLKDTLRLINSLILLNTRQIRAHISIYTLQEIYTFCKKIFPSKDVGHIAKFALSDLFKNEFEISGLLSRNDRLLYRTQFNLDDLSDQPHAISAYINKCESIVTYDRHFQKIKDKILVYSPEEIISQFIK
jgi:hypothetical protein